MNFYFLPIALAASPVALSLVPRLSRMTGPGQAGLFRDTYRARPGLRMLPRRPGGDGLRGPRPAARRARSASAPSAAGGGRDLIAAALAGLAPAIVGETLFLYDICLLCAQGHHPSAARDDHPGGRVRGRDRRRRDRSRRRALLTGLGLAFSAGSLVAARYLVRSLRRELPRGGEPTLRPFAADLHLLGHHGGAGVGWRRTSWPAA